MTPTQTWKKNIEGFQNPAQWNFSISQNRNPA